MNNRVLSTSVLYAQNESVEILSGNNTYVCLFGLVVIVYCTVLEVGVNYGIDVA